MPEHHKQAEVDVIEDEEKEGSESAEDLSVERAWLDANFPKTRKECKDGPRPCPFFRCRYHLGLILNKKGKVTVNFEKLRKKKPTCALDIAEGGPSSEKSVAKLMGMSREKVREDERRALVRLQIQYPELIRILRDFKEK